jgi:hypothetical protein
LDGRFASREIMWCHVSYHMYEYSRFGESGDEMTIYNAGVVQHISSCRHEATMPVSQFNRIAVQGISMYTTLILESR